MSEDRVLALRDLTVERGGTRVVDGLSLEVRRGERLGVLAEDDSSRSALVAAMLGSPEETDRIVGEVTFYPSDGSPVDVLDLSRSAARRFRWRRVALVPANAAGAFNPSTTVRTAFEETLRAHDADVSDGMDRAVDLLTALGRGGEAILGTDAEAILEALPNELQSGDQVRAAVALALLLEPSVLVVEDSDPALRLLAGDPPAVSNDLAVVALGSDPRSVASFATRLAVLYGGEIVEDGETEEVVEEPAHPATRELLSDI